MSVQTALLQQIVEDFSLFLSALLATNTVKQREHLKVLDIALRGSLTVPRILELLREQGLSQSTVRVDQRAPSFRRQGFP